MGVLIKIIVGLEFNVYIVMRVLDHGSEICGGREIDRSGDMGKGVRQGGGRRRHDFEEATGDLHQELSVVEAYRRSEKKIQWLQFL